MICIATSASDLGVNNPLVTFVVNFEWFDSIATGVQRKGCGSRNEEPSEVLFITGIQSYIMLNKRMYGQQHVQDDDDNDDNNPHNSTVVAPKTKQMSDARKKMEVMYPLEEEEKDAILARLPNSYMKGLV